MASSAKKKRRATSISAPVVVQGECDLLLAGPRCAEAGRARQAKAEQKQGGRFRDCCRRGADARHVVGQFVTVVLERLARLRSEDARTAEGRLDAVRPEADS